MSFVRLHKNNSVKRFSLYQSTIIINVSYVQVLSTIKFKINYKDTLKAYIIRDIDI